MQVYLTLGPKVQFCTRSQRCRQTSVLKRRTRVCVLVPQLSSVTQLCLTLPTPWTAACQASLSITNSRSLLKLISIESIMPPNHLILCCPLLLLLSIFPRIRVFSNESILHIRWPKYWSFSFNISPFNITIQKHQFFGAQLSL